MLTLSQYITFGAITALALLLVSYMLLARAAAAGHDAGVARRRIAVIWLCALLASGVGVTARALMGGHLFDLAPGTLQVEFGGGQSWPAAAAMLVIVVLLMVAMRQARVLTSDPPDHAAQDAAADD